MDNEYPEHNFMGHINPDFIYESDLMYFASTIGSKNCIVLIEP